MPAGDPFCNYCNRLQYCCICPTPTPKTFGVTEEPWLRKVLDDAKHSRSKRLNSDEEETISQNIMKEPTLNELINDIIKPAAIKLIKLSDKGLRNTLNDLGKSIDEVIDKKTKAFKDTIDESGSDESFNKLFETVFGQGNIPVKNKSASATVEDEFNTFFKEPLKKKTLVVNLYGGPGTGKSTMAAGIFYELKMLGINCELITEYPKDLVWEKRNNTFENQIYVFAKQFHRLFNVLNQVDVIITDSPILMYSIYDSQKRETLKKLIYEEHKKLWTYNVFLKRSRKYNPVGRYNSEKQAQDLDIKIRDLLTDSKEMCEVFNTTHEEKDRLVKKILTLIKK